MVLTDNPLPLALFSREPGLRLYYYLTDNLSQGPCSIPRRLFCLLFIVITLENPNLQYQAVRNESSCLVVLTSCPGRGDGQRHYKEILPWKATFLLQMGWVCEQIALKIQKVECFYSGDCSKWIPDFAPFTSKFRRSFYVSQCFSFSQVYAIKQA